MKEDRAFHHGSSREEEHDELDEDDQMIEAYDENEVGMEERRKHREADMADGDEAAHQHIVRTSSRRGFAAMDKEKQRMIASKGGKASHGGGRKPGKNR